MPNKLKPCPFCGGEAERNTYAAYSLDSSFDYIGYKDCGALFIEGTKEEWNKRTSNSLLKQLYIHHKSQAKPHISPAAKIYHTELTKKKIKNFIEKQ